MKKEIIILLSFISIILNSCSLDDQGPNFHFVPLKIVSAELPESFTLNETYEIKVTYEIPNNCTVFEGFDITKSDKTVRNVVGIGSEFENEQCNDSSLEQETTFSFICLYTEPYLFRFWTGEDENGESEYFEVEVTVN